MPFHVLRYSVKTCIKNFLYQLLIPFVIIHIRIIQYRYKHISVNNPGNQNSQLCSTLELLQAKEYYYETQFSAWGRFHPSFSFSGNQMYRHLKFMNWLFPEKDFKEWDLVIWQNPRAVTYYHNKIWDLSKQRPPIYEIAIPEQLKNWKHESQKHYLTKKKKHAKASKTK